MNRRVTSDGTGPTKERRVFAQNLSNRLKVLKMSGAELARQAEISRDAVSSYTSMRSIPTKETLARIAKALRCKPKDLLPPLTEDELNTIIEVREYNEQGMSLLIARVPLRSETALAIAQTLQKEAPNNHKKKAR